MDEVQLTLFGVRVTKLESEQKEAQENKEGKGHWSTREKKN